MSDYLRLVRQYTIAVLLAVFAGMLAFSLAPGAGLATFLLGLAIVAARMMFRYRPAPVPSRVSGRPTSPLSAAATLSGSGTGVASTREGGTQALPAWLRLSFAVLTERETNVEGMLALVRR